MKLVIIHTHQTVFLGEKEKGSVEPYLFLIQVELTKRFGFIIKAQFIITPFFFIFKEDNILIIHSTEIES